MIIVSLLCVRVGLVIDFEFIQELFLHVLVITLESIDSQLELMAF